MLTVSLLFLVALLVLTVADEAFYQLSDAAFHSDVQLDLAPADLPIVKMNLLVSNDAHAATTHPLFGTFIGSFSSSGPHNLGVLSVVGQTYEPSVQLEREVGELRGIQLEVQGPDSLLLSTASVLIGSTVFELAVAEQWVEVWDPAVALANGGDGFSPDASSSLPSSSTLLLPVSDSYLFYSSTGPLSG